MHALTENHSSLVAHPLQITTYTRLMPWSTFRLSSLISLLIFSLSLPELIARIRYNSTARQPPMGVDVLAFLLLSRFLVCLSLPAIEMITLYVGDTDIDCARINVRDHQALACNSVFLCLSWPLSNDSYRFCFLVEAVQQVPTLISAQLI